MDISQITTDLASAKRFYLLQLEVIRQQMLKGCGSVKSVQPLGRLIKALQWQVDLQVNDSVTTKLYACLKAAIGDYGATYNADTTVIVPGQTIVVNYTIPPAVEITYDDMTIAGTVYDNPLWAGFDPFLILDNTVWLNNGVDYDLSSNGGFRLRIGGGVPAIYPGQIIRALTYQKV